MLQAYHFEMLALIFQLFCLVEAIWECIPSGRRISIKKQSYRYRILYIKTIVPWHFLYVFKLKSVQRTINNVKTLFKNCLKLLK